MCILSYEQFLCEFQVKITAKATLYITVFETDMVAYFCPKYAIMQLLICCMLT